MTAMDIEALREFCANPGPFTERIYDQRTSEPGCSNKPPTGPHGRG